MPLCGFGDKLDSMPTSASSGGTDDPFEMSIMRNALILQDVVPAFAGTK